MRTFLPSVAIASLLVPYTSSAIGLGDIDVYSGLNQPFHAEVFLHDLQGVSLGDIRVSFATKEQYQRMDIERLSVLPKLTLKVISNKRGKPVIEIKSDVRMTEPYLQLLLDVSAPTGNLIRGYNVLLDPVEHDGSLPKKSAKKNVSSAVKKILQR